MITLRTLRLLMLAVLVAGCSVDRIPGVYRIDIQQGNVVTKEMIDQLQPGMTREQVRFIMGSPMLTDTFSADRWDYLFTYRPGNGQRTQRRVVVHFTGDRFARVSGDLPTAAEGTNALANRTVEVTGKSVDDRGVLRRIWDGLTDWGGKE